MTYWSCYLQPPWPLLSQNSPVTADGAPPENAANDCAETCASTLIQWLTGIDCLDPDTINSVMFYNGHVGVTSIPKIQDFLLRHAKIGTTQLALSGAMTGTNSATYWIWYYTKDNHPVFALRTYSETVKTLHWVVVIGIDPTSIWYFQPWNGTIVQESYQTFYNNLAAAGTVMGSQIMLSVDRSRDSV